MNRVLIRKTGAAWAAGLIALASFVGVGVGVAHAQTTYTDAAQKALTWVKTQQQPDGSFAGFGAGSTVDALLAIVAAGQDPAAWASGGNTPLDFLRSKAGELAKTPGGAGKLLIVVGALGQDPMSFGGVNLVDAVNGSYDAGTGHYGKDAIGHAFAILGLTAAKQQVPAKSIDFLKSTQTSDGGWAFSGDTKAGGADTNTTAVVVQALVAAGAAGPDNSLTVKMAVTYLVSQQNADGGFAYQKNDPTNNESDVNSTAYVAQAMHALGNTTMYEQAAKFMASLQKPDGAFQWKKSEPDDNAGATYQAIPALLGATLAQPSAPPSGGGQPEPGTSEPGMPSTGSGTDEAVPALAALAMLAVGSGLAARRRVAAR